MLIKRQPPFGRKLLVIGTTSQGDVAESMGLSEVFNVSLHVPALRAEEIHRVVRELDVFAVHEVGVGMWVWTVDVWTWGYVRIRVRLSRSWTYMPCKGCVWTCGCGHVGRARVGMDV